MKPDKITITGRKNGTFYIVVRRYDKEYTGMRPSLFDAQKAVTATWTKLYNEMVTGTLGEG